MAARVTWCVYYDDGTAFSDADGRPEDAPTSGVLVIRQSGGHDSPLANVDHYLWRADHGCWLPVMHDGLVDQVCRYAPVITACLNGATVPYPEWQRLVKARGLLVREGPI
jgi:hypothetical protein